MSALLRLGVIGGACASFLKSSSTWLGATSVQAAAILALLLATASSQAQLPTNVYDYTRTDQFTYDPTTGFMLTHTVEPTIGALCSVETFGYDATGNRNRVQTANCTATVAVPSNALFTTRNAGASFVAPATQNITVNGATVAVTYPAGLAMTQQTNAATQSESHQIDPRFGELLALTGPNALTTSWSLDDFGRVVRETAPDGTSAVSFYCVLPINGSDTSSNSAGCITPSPDEVPGDAASFVQGEPHNSSDVKDGPFVRTYSDRLGRVIRTVTQSFDGVSQPSGLSGALVVQDTVYNAFGAVTYTTQPYFLSSLSSTTTGSGDFGMTAATYDVLGRATQVITSDPDGNAGSQSFGSYGSRTAAMVTNAYSGYTTTITNDKGQTRVEERNVAGELVRMTDATGAQLVHQTDAFGNLVATKDALQNTISIAFDIRGNRTSVNDPDGGITLDCYDALGELVAYQYANMRGGAAPGACPTTPNNGGPSATATTGWVTEAYDVLGRATQRIEPEFTSAWSYDKYADSSACAKGVGKLCQAVTSAGFNRKVVYDAMGRPLDILVTTGTGPSFASAVSYDAPTGRVASATYPTGLQVGYAYTALGYPEKLLLSTAATVTPLAPPVGGGSSGGTVGLTAGTVLWQAQSVNAWGALEKQIYSNGVATISAYEAATGRVTDLKAGASTAANVLNHHYVWDSLDNLQARNDANGDGSTGAVTESFNYADGLNRLTGYTVSGASVPGLSRTVLMQYNALGMLLYKSDVGNYAYGAQGAGAVRPHALLNVINSSTTTNGYDANGNLTSASTGKYSSLTYTSFNLPDSQTGLAGPSGTPQYTWNYDDTHTRIKEVKTATGANPGTRTTWYMHPDNAGGLGFESEINSTTNPALNDNRHFLTAAGNVVGVLVSTGAVPAPVGTAPASPPSPFPLVKVEYWHQDHLGSLAATTDHLGNVTARYAYDPFGKRRFTNGSYDANGQLVVDWSPSSNAGTARGFTGHESLDDVGLVHMNGRLFDPTLGVFLQVDPYVSHPANLQSFNRYGYCLNNPLTCTDPSGLADKNDDQQGTDSGGGVGMGNGGTAGDGSGNLPQQEVVVTANAIPAQWTGSVVTVGTTADGIQNVTICAYCNLPPGLTPITLNGTGGGGDNSQSPGHGPPAGTGLEGLSGSGGSTNGEGNGGANSGGSRNSPTGNAGSSNPGAGSPTAGSSSAGNSAPAGAARNSGASASSSLSGWVHAGLGAASLCPSVCGSVFSAADGVVSLIEGDKIGAAVSFGAAVIGVFSDAGAAKIVAEAALEIREEALASKIAAGCGCFVAGTPIETEGGEVAIEQIHVGTMVLSRNEVTGQPELKPVTRVFNYEGREIYSLVLLDEQGRISRLEVTDDHPFMVVGRGWTKSIDLRTGMRVDSMGHRVLIVAHLQAGGRVDATYNLEVADNHTFFAGDAHVLVHNASCAIAAKGLGNQNPLYKAAVSQFKNTELSNAGRALTKHPELIGETKETLRQTLRTDEALNDAAQESLRNIMRNGVTTTPTLGRYGTVTQIQISGGFGARWASDGSFIGFINP